MTDANVTDLKLNDLFISDTDETKDEKSFSFDKEAATEEIPPSLISYFETSKSRASVCEKLILEELDDFTTSYEDTMNLHIALNEDMELNEQGVCETRNENNTSTDSFLLPTPTDTEAHGTHNLSVCTNNEDKTDTDEHMESGKHLTFRTSLIDKEIKENSEWQREHTENQHFEEMKKEERVRQRENDFQEELNKLMEAEKLHQVELQLMEKRAQEKLEHELLLQQELISNLQKHVEEERRMIDEEIKRIKEEEEKKKKEKEEKKKREEEDMKKREEEKIKRQMQRERMEEERRRANEEEENRKIKEIKEAEERRNKVEEQRKKKEEEEKRKREEEKNKMQKEIRKKEEERKKEIRLKEEENRRQMEEEERKIKGMENNIKVKEKNKEEETMKREQEKTVIKVTGKKMEGDKKRKNEEEESLDEEGLRKKEWRIRAEEDKTKKADVKIAEELEMKTQQEEKKEEGKSEEERKEAEIEKMMDKEMRKKEEKMSNIRNEVQLTENKEKRKKDVDGRHNIENKYRRTEEEKITKEEEWKKSQGEEMKRHKNVKDEYRKIEEEISLKEGNKTYEADKEKRHEHEKLEKDGTRKKEGGEINTEADERQMKEEVSETKAGNIKTEGKGLEEEEESKMIIVKETVEKEEKRANDLQEKNLIENDCTNTTDERNNTARTGNSLTSQLEDNSICTSSGPGPLYSDSISFETAQRGDQEMNIIETYTNKTMDQQDAAGKLCTSPSSLLWCLPEDTEQKRLSWMKYCIPWSTLSLQNRRKHKGSVRSQRLPRRAAEASSLPPLCPDTLLQSTGCKSLQELTTVTLEDLPGCSLSTLVQCTQLRSLSLRRCGLKSLEGISQLSKLCYIDVEENEISFVNCENMTSLRVLRLGHNKLTSIHGLSGADNLDVLELSHNNITRIAGLESMRKLQRLSVDHNQLISTKGLRDVYTLLHLNCSHNHLTSVEGLENSSLLNTLELRANSLTEPPSLDNHVLLRELHLDDNSISSLQCLTACWLPLMQHLSVAQNRITQLHSMSDFVSLAYLDLRFNCMSELQNVCKSLERCYCLKDLYLTGNPLQQESGWRSTLQRSLPGLKAIDDQETDTFLSHPAVQQISFASASFLTFCQAQFRQIDDLQQQHSRELSKASTSQDTMKSLCRHFTETLKLAEDQRFAHEYGDITVSAGQTVLEKTADTERNNAEKLTGHAQTEPSEEVPAVIPSKNNIRCSYFTAEEKLSTENCSHTLDTMATETGLQGKTSSSISKRAALSNHQDLDLKNTAAVVIQQQWKKYRQKYGNTSRPPAAEKGGRTGENEGNPESASFYVNESVVDQHYAATVIQAFWRGCSVRRRLASALAAVTYPSTREDDTFEEVDVDEFVFDEAELEKHWKLQFSEDSSSRHEPVSEQPLSLKFPGPLSDPSQYTLPPPPVWRPKQAWVAGEDSPATQVDSAEQRVSPESSHRKSSASTSVLSGISERSEKILDEWGFTDSHTALLMLKRAQKMKSKHQQKKKHRDPSVRLALFRNCSFQLSPEEARNKPTPHSRNDKKVCRAVLGLQQAEKTEQVKQERAQQWLHTQSGRGSESEHFLPEISSDILNGGRVQLVCVQADTACSERRHPNGLRANSSLSAQPGKQNSNPHRISLAHARKDVTSPKRVTSAPSKKERISFRDNPVQLSGGWGGGKKREKVHK